MIIWDTWYDENLDFWYAVNNKDNRKHGGFYTEEECLTWIKKKYTGK